MIAHVVLVTPRSDLSASERAAAIETLRRAASDVPEVLRCRIGRRVKHGLPGYEQRMPHNYELALLLEFRDIDALQRYLKAPAHVALGRLFSTASSAAIAYDYEIVEPADTAHLFMV